MRATLSPHVIVVGALCICCLCIVCARCLSTPALDLDVFDDDDCLETPTSGVLLSLLHDMADLLDEVLFAESSSESGWLNFDIWYNQHKSIMVQMAVETFGRPYCEPGKMAWMAAECIIVLRADPQSALKATECAEQLDENFLTQMTPRGSKYETRMHLTLRSPWPAFRLLDHLTRLHPVNNSTRMGSCRRFRNWRDDADVFDWPSFKPLLISVADSTALNPHIFALQPEDGPLSQQYQARWLRLHGHILEMGQVMAFSDDVFVRYREHHYKAGCHLGLIACYILQMFWVLLRDGEGRLHRYVASVAQLINLHADLPHLIQSDWPIFRLLHRLGVEVMVAKYLALAASARVGIHSAWLDLDVYVATDPSKALLLALNSSSRVDLVFAKHMMTESVSPAVVLLRGSSNASVLAIRYAAWLRENPYLLDHQGWDQMSENNQGDFAGVFDYKGRNTTVQDDEGPSHSFPPIDGVHNAGARFAVLGDEFGSGDGWRGRHDFADLVFFHFWGANETQTRLFELFYPHRGSGFSPDAQKVLGAYRKVSVAAPTARALRLGAAATGDHRSMRLVTVSYASGCCEQALQKNLRQAKKVGVDEARGYDAGDLGPVWAARHRSILSQKRGGGWWLWKPYVILRALQDTAVPWHRGVVIWVDAGNFLHADPRGLVEKALEHSDVAGIRLKCCHEADWTSDVSLSRLRVSSRYAVINRPQIGAYFLLFRKTQLTIDFVKRWLHESEHEEALLGVSPDRREDDISIGVPGFQKHQADQSIFSVLFKEYGFQAFSLEEGHSVITLARWRE